MFFLFIRQEGGVANIPRGQIAAAIKGRERRRMEIVLCVSLSNKRKLNRVVNSFNYAVINRHRRLESDDVYGWGVGIGI